MIQDHLGNPYIRALLAAIVIAAVYGATLKVRGAPLQIIRNEAFLAAGVTFAVIAGLNLIVDAPEEVMKEPFRDIGAPSGVKDYIV